MAATTGGAGNRGQEGDADNRVGEGRWTTKQQPTIGYDEGR